MHEWLQTGVCALPLRITISSCFSCLTCRLADLIKDCSNQHEQLQWLNHRRRLDYNWSTQAASDLWSSFATADPVCREKNDLCGLLVRGLKLWNDLVSLSSSVPVDHDALWAAHISPDDPRLFDYSHLLMLFREILQWVNFLLWVT